MKVPARMLVRMSDVDTLSRQIRLPRASGNTKNTEAPASTPSNCLLATLRKEDRRAHSSRWFSAIDVSGKSCGSEKRTKESYVKRRAKEELLKIPLSPQSHKRLTLLIRIRRALMKSGREGRGAIDGSALHDHNHPVGGNPSQTRDGGAVLDHSILCDAANQARIIGLDSLLYLHNLNRNTFMVPGIDVLRLGGKCHDFVESPFRSDYSYPPGVVRHPQ